MTAGRFATVAAIVSCALAAPRRAAAQTGADTTELAPAVAALLADSLLDRMTNDKPIVWDHSSRAPDFGALNAAVAGLLRMHPRLRGPVADRFHTMWIYIRQASASGDSARVEVEFGQDYGGGGELTFWTERRAYFFAREAKKTGWRFVRSLFIEHADGGPVRG
jgi:hypothetical protein